MTIQRSPKASLGNTDLVHLHSPCPHTKAQRGEGVCPKSHSWNVPEVRPPFRFYPQPQDSPITSLLDGRPLDAGASVPTAHLPTRAPFPCSPEPAPSWIDHDASRSKQRGFSAPFGLSHLVVLQLHWRRATALICCALCPLLPGALTTPQLAHL